MKKLHIKKAAVIIMYAVATFLIGHYSSWFVVLGIFIWQWADNVQDANNKEERIDKIANEFFNNNASPSKSKFMQKLDEAMERSKNAK